MEFGVLGPLRVLDNNVPVRLGPAKTRCLLAALLCGSGQPISVDTLVDELWHHTPPPTARKTLQVYVCRLRRVLGPDRRVGFDSTSYQMALYPGELDASRFDAAMARARECRRNADLDGAAGYLHAAAGLWRGEPFSDVRGGGLIEAERVRFTEQRLLMFEERAEIDLARGLAAELVPELESLVLVHPFRDRMRAALMRALYHSGQAVHALEIYQHGRDLLRDELGLDPGPELRRLHQSMLRNDLAGSGTSPG